jgi:hypothetical protein
VAARDKKDVRFRGTIVGAGDVEWTFDDKNEFPAAHRDKDALEAAALAATIRIIGMDAKGNARTRAHKCTAGMRCAVSHEAEERAV